MTAVLTVDTYVNALLSASWIKSNLQFTIAFIEQMPN